MRLLHILTCCLIVQVAVAQGEGKLIQPTTEMGGTVFANYEDAATFLRGLIGAESDNYGNLTLFKDGSWSQRAAFRLSDVGLVAKVTPPTMNNAGSMDGPRIAISAKCVSGPCIIDPLMKDMGLMEEKSFFVSDSPEGRKVYSTLLVMQRFLQK